MCFYAKSLNRLDIEGRHLNIIKATFENPSANIILNGEKLAFIPLISGTRQVCPFSPLLFSLTQEVPARTTSQGKNEKDNQSGKA